MDCDKVLNEYDELRWQLAKTYGAHTGHGLGDRGSAVTLHKQRNILAEQIREKRKLILTLMYDGIG